MQSCGIQLWFTLIPFFFSYFLSERSRAHFGLGTLACFTGINAYLLFFFFFKRLIPTKSTSVTLFPRLSVQ